MQEPGIKVLVKKEFLNLIDHFVFDQDSVDELVQLPLLLFVERR